MPRKNKNARQTVTRNGTRRIPHLNGRACKDWLRKDAALPADSLSASALDGQLIGELKKVKRWDIWYANLGLHSDSSVQGGTRPVLIISNDDNNRNANTLTVIPLTTKHKKMSMPTHVLIRMGKGSPLDRVSVALAEQITTIDKTVLTFKVGELSQSETKEEILVAVLSQIGL